MIHIQIPGYDSYEGDGRHGDCQIITSDSIDYAVIVDSYCGDYGKQVIAILKKRGISKVYLYCSHPHYDHLDGLKKIMADSYFSVLGFGCYDPDTLNGGSSNSEIKDDINYLKNAISYCYNKRIPVRYLKHGDKCEHGDIKFNVYRKQEAYQGASEDPHGWAFLNDGSLCFWFYELLYWTSGDGPMSIYDMCKANGAKPVVFKIPHHGNNCNAYESNGLKSLGAKLCWDNSYETNANDDFLKYGRRRCIEAGIKYIGIHGDINIVCCTGHIHVYKDWVAYSYVCPYNGKNTFKAVDDSIVNAVLNGKAGNGNARMSYCIYNNYNPISVQNAVNDAVSGKTKRWVKDENGWRYGYGSTWSKGWILVNGYWYYLDPSSGYMQIGWLDYKNKKCYLEPVSGKNQGHAYRNEEAIIDGVKYSFDNDCYAHVIGDDSDSSSDSDESKDESKDESSSEVKMQNGIDISNHQAGMNLNVVLAQTKTDFVICKATEGVSFVDKYCNGFASVVQSTGKQFGFYHFARPENNSAVDEAKFFLDNTKGYFGKGIPVLDWESSGKSKVAWAKEWLDYVYKATGIRPVIYMSESVVNAYNWSSVASANYGLWVAKYRDYNVDSNYDMSTCGKKPSVKWWSFYMMWQWTSVGRLSGYSGNLDCNAFYGDAEAWMKYVGSATVSTGGVEVDKIYAYETLAAELPVIRHGANCNAVRLVQLITGVPYNHIDGEWGDETESYVKKWEEAHGLTADGLFDKPDWKLAMDWLATV